MNELGPRVTKILESIKTLLPGFEYIMKQDRWSNFDTVFIRRGSEYGWHYTTTVHDIIGWNEQQIVGHVCAVLGIPTPTVIIVKEKELMDLDKIAKQGEDDGIMWLSLVNPQVPFMTLRRFATFCASTRGIQTMEAGNEYCDNFMQVFVDYQNANKVKEVTDGGKA